MIKIAISYIILNDSFCILITLKPDYFNKKYPITIRTRYFFLIKELVFTGFENILVKKKIVTYHFWYSLSV